MTAPAWLDSALGVLTLLTALGGGVWALMEIRGRRIFVTREQYDRDRAMDNQRLAEVVVEPLRQIAETLEEVRRESHAQAELLAAQQEWNRAMTDSIHDLRQAVRRIEQED